MVQFNYFQRTAEYVVTLALIGLHNKIIESGAKINKLLTLNTRLYRSKNKFHKIHAWSNLEDEILCGAFGEVCMFEPLYSVRGWENRNSNLKRPGYF